MDFISCSFLTWAEKIVIWTVRRLPKTIQEKYEQIWLGDLDDHQTGVSKLIFALSLRLGLSLLTKECEKIAEIENQRLRSANQNIIRIGYIQNRELFEEIARYYGRTDSREGFLDNLSALTGFSVKEIRKILLHLHCTRISKMLTEVVEELPTSLQEAK